MAELLLRPEVLSILLIGSLTGLGWLFRKTLVAVFMGLKAGFYGPIYVRIDETEEKLMTEMGYLRRNGQAFSDRMTSGERRTQQIAEELNDFRESSHHRLEKLEADSIR